MIPLGPTDCGVTDCGTRRCQTCDERLACTGPEPVAVACPAHDNECADCAASNPCHDCRMERMTAAAEAAWNAEPTRTWDNPRTQADIDSRAESRHEQDNYEYAELMMREQDARW